MNCPKCNQPLSTLAEGYVYECPSCKISYNKELQAISLREHLRLLGEYKKNCPDQFARDIEEDRILQEEARNVPPPIVTCPKCGSTQIQMVPRKWSIWTGVFTNKVDRVCVNCKNKF